jgi:hypothetical protein
MSQTASHDNHRAHVFYIHPSESRRENYLLSAWQARVGKAVGFRTDPNKTLAVTKTAETLLEAKPRYE